MVRLVLIVVAAAACASPEEGRPPVARITVTPRAIPAGDAFTTDVVLDGSESADPVDDPGGTTPVAYRWQIEDDEARFLGDPRDALVTVRFAALRPARILLTVTDADGGEATATERLQLTLAR